MSGTIKFSFFLLIRFDTSLLSILFFTSFDTSLLLLHHLSTEMVRSDSVTNETQRHSFVPFVQLLSFTSFHHFSQFFLLSLSLSEFIISFSLIFSFPHALWNTKHIQIVEMKTKEFFEKRTKKTNT